MRKLRLLFATLVLLVTGVVAVNAADTAPLAAEDGWQKITAMPSTLSDYYFAILDNSEALMLTLSRGNDNKQQTAYNGLFYKTAGNPLVDKSMLFTLETDGDYLVMTNAEYSDLFLQTEWNAQWYYRTHDNGGGNKEWGHVKFTFQDSNATWTIQNGRYYEADANYLGPWDDVSPANGVDLALNKSADKKGTFQIYAILKTDAEAFYNKLLAGIGASETNPLDMTALIVNPNARFWTGSAPFGWTTTGLQNIHPGNGPDDFPGIFEYCTWSANSWTGSLKQTLTVPNGYYELKAWFMSSEGVNAYLTANDVTSESVTQFGDDPRFPQQLTAAVTVTNGQLEIGCYASAETQYRWINTDNFTLTYLGPAATTDYTISVNLTHPSSMTELPSVGVTGTGVTQNGDNSYKAPSGTAITVTPEAVDGYTVNVTVAEDNDVTQGEGQSITPTQSNGTWSFTSTERNITVTVTYEEIPTFSIYNLKYNSQVTIGEVSTTIGDVSTITGVNAGELVTIDVSDIAVSPGNVWVIHANTAVGALTEEALSHVGDVWTFTMPEGDAYLTFEEEYVYSTFTLNVTEGEGMTEAPDVSYSPQFTNAGKVRSGSNVTINIPAYAGYDATATYQAASDAEPTTLTISNNQAQLTMPAEDVTATVVYTKHAYTISGLPVDNTTFTIGDTQYESGDVKATEGTVITVTPALNYQITAMTATYTPATGGDPIELTIDDAAGNGKSFTMPAADVTVTCTAEEIVIDPDAIPVIVPALSFVTYVDAVYSLALATGSTAQLYGVSDVTATEVQLTSQLTEVPMGHHFLIYNPTEADIIAQLMVIDLAGSMEGVGSNWDFIDPTGSTIDPESYDGSSIYLCGGKQFLKAIGAGKLAEHRWMLLVADETEGGDQPSARAIVFGETTNKITATNIKNATKGDFFDLQGRKVKAPKKGLYIVNGKKAVIK